jgi:hypothetical protein
MLQLICDHGPNLNAMLGEEYDMSTFKTLLLVGIETGDLTTVKFLVEMGAKVDVPATRGVERTPLQAAAEGGCIDIVEYLLSRGVNPNEPPAVRSGATALQLAAIGGYCGIAERLIMAGAEVNGPTAKVDGMSAIEGPAAFGRIRMAKILLDHGASLGNPTSEGMPKAIRLAKEEGHLATARFLESWLAKSTVPDPKVKNKGVPCVTCGRYVSNMSALSRHMATVHSGATPYRCGEAKCTRSFARKDLLERHEAVHTRRGYIECTGCKKPFRPDYYRKDHLNKHGQCKRTVGDVPIANHDNEDAEFAIDAML